MNGQLQEQLRSLQRIRPDALFLARGRATLMNAITPAPRITLNNISLSSFIPTLRLSAAMGALSLFLLLGTSQAPYGPAETVAGLNANAIQAERPSARAEGSVANTDYFNNISPVISLALADIADPSTNWGSSNQIKQSIALLYKNN